VTRFTAIIPARGGSRGLPRKNVLPLAGKPLIGWTIDAARSATHIDRVIVTTDDDEIASVARQHGADVPFRRPAHLASDEASTFDVVAHVIETLAVTDPIAMIALLQPTSPLRSAADIDAAASLFDERDASAVVSVTPFTHPLHWLRGIDANGELQTIGTSEVSRRQDAAPLYQLNGAIYLQSAASLLRERTFVPPHAVAYVMPAERSVDIDTLIDFQLAELLMKERRAA